ncbi:MAG: metal ABC transporter solute-binding protein, Zn/Mn family, partial [Nitrosopumilus sp.]
MKKPILTASIAAVAIIIGISVVFVENNNDVKINDLENSDGISKKIIVTTTTNVITDLVENIGGDHVSVTGLMGPGVDPHLYRP